MVFKLLKQIYLLSKNKIKKKKKLTVFDLITTVRLGFSNLLGTLIRGKNMYLLRIHYKNDQIRTLIFNDDYALLFSDFLCKCICCGYSFEMHRSPCNSRINGYCEIQMTN